MTRNMLQTVDEWLENNFWFENMIWVVFFMVGGATLSATHPFKNSILFEGFPTATVLGSALVLGTVIIWFAFNNLVSNTERNVIVSSNIGAILTVFGLAVNFGSVAGLVGLFVLFLVYGKYIAMYQKHAPEYQYPLTTTA